MGPAGPLKEGSTGDASTRAYLAVRCSARMWSRLVDGLAGLGTLMIGALMLFISADIVTRNLLGGSLPLVSELTALTLVMIVFLQLATTARHERLVRSDILLSRLGRHLPRVRSGLEALFDLSGATIVAIIAWSTCGILQRDLESREFIGVTGIVTVPTWPFRLLIAVGMSVAALQFAAQAIRRLHLMRKVGPDPRR